MLLLHNNHHYSFLLVNNSPSSQHNYNQSVTDVVSSYQLQGNTWEIGFSYVKRCVCAHMRISQCSYLEHDTCRSMLCHSSLAMLSQLFALVALELLKYSHSQPPPSGRERITHKLLHVCHGLAMLSWKLLTVCTK